MASIRTLTLILLFSFNYSANAQTAFPTVLTVQGPNSICPGGSVMLTVPNIKNSTYKWFHNGTWISPYNVRSFWNATLPGTYYCIITETVKIEPWQYYSYTNTYTSNTVTITQSSAPNPLNISISSGTATGCAGQVILNVTNPIAGSTVNWHKTGSSEVFPTGNTLTINGNAGDYYCSYIPPGCTKIPSNIISLNAGANIASTFGNDSIKFCTSGPLMANPAGASYQWKLNGTNINGAVNRNINAVSTGIYTCEITNSCGTVISNPIIATAGVGVSKIEAPLGTDYCPGGIIPFLKVVQHEPGNNYQWLPSLPGVVSDNDLIYQPTYTEAIRLRVINACTAGQYSNTIQILQKNTNEEIIGGGTFCNSTTISLSPGSSAWTGVQWYKNGISIPGANSTSLQVTQTGWYNCVFGNGCKSDSSAIGKLVKINTNTVLFDQVITSSITSPSCNRTFTISVPPQPGCDYYWSCTNTPGAARKPLPFETTNSPTITVSEPTASYANYHVLFVNGCTNNQAQPKIFNFTQNLPLTVTSNAATNFCPGSNITLTANTTGNVSYQWYRGVVPVGNNNTKVADTTSIYKVVVTEFPSGCQNSVNVPVYEGPPAGNISALTTELCPGQVIPLWLSNGQGYTYQWARNGVPTGTNNDSLFIDSAGVYTATITSPCGTHNTQPLIITNPAVPGISGSSAICSGDSAALTCSLGPSGYSYQWYRNNVLIPGAIQKTYYAKKNGAYKVIVTKNGCSLNSNPFTFTVNPKPPAVITALSSLHLCVGTTADMQANTGSNLTYKWKKYNTEIPGATFPTYSTNTPGTYRVQVTNAQGCTKLSPGIIVTKAPVVKIAPFGNLSMCNGDIMTLTADTGYSDYKWLKNGSVIPGAISPVYQASAAGNYKVRITDQYGCTKTTGNLAAANISINCRDGNYSESNQQLLSIHPNPASSEILIKVFDNSSNRRYIIYNSFGEIVKDFYFRGPELYLSLKHWEKGLYFIKMTSSETDWIIGKFLII